MVKTKVDTKKSPFNYELRQSVMHGRNNIAINSILDVTTVIKRHAQSDYKSHNIVLTVTSNFKALQISNCFHGSSLRLLFPCGNFRL